MAVVVPDRTSGLLLWRAPFHVTSIQVAGQATLGAIIGTGWWPRTGFPGWFARAKERLQCLRAGARHDDNIKCVSDLASTRPFTPGANMNASSVRVSSRC